LPLGAPHALATRAHRGRCRRDHRSKSPRGVAVLRGLSAPLPRRRNAYGAGFGLRREHLMVEIVAGWNQDGDDCAAHGAGRTISGRASPRSPCRAATPTCSGRAIASKRRGLMAATPPGSGPSSVASIPMESSRLPSRCRRGKSDRFHLKRIPSELKSNRISPAADCRFLASHLEDTR
jgi:hypothetical protein